MDRLISEQAVIDAICKVCAVDVKPSECRYRKGLFGGCNKYEAIKAIPSEEPQDSEDKIIRRTLENFMRGLWEEIQVGELEYTTSEVYEMLEREIFTDNHVTISSADKWIPCSERLPKEGEDVLACFYTGEGNYKMMVSRRSDYNYWSGVGRTADMVAWMPLPTPYEPQKSEG